MRRVLRPGGRLVAVVRATGRCADGRRHEVNSKSDYKSAGVKKHECEGKAHDPDDDEDEE